MNANTGTAPMPADPPGNTAMAPLPAAPYKATFALDVGEGKSILLKFSASIAIHAVSPGALDVWTVMVGTAEGAERRFAYRMCTGGRCRGPDPLAVLKCIASLVESALRLPGIASEGQSIDFLFDEGYAETPSEALALFRRLVTAYVAASCVLDGTGLTLRAFAGHVGALPYEPRCALPMPGHAQPQSPPQTPFTC
jgi:hypothetical protein